MKNVKRSTLVILLFLFVLKVVADPVDAERARLVAKHFLNNNGAVPAGLKDLSARAGFANVYVFSTESSFVLVAADDRVQPILGYSLNGRFDLSNLPENKKAWIEEYGTAIRYAVEHQTKASAEVQKAWNDLAAGKDGSGTATVIVGPLIQTQWNQGTPYNLLCPSGSVTGCVATAMAQVMKYWNYPAHGVGSHSYIHPDYGELSADFQSTYYDWSNMTNTYGSSSTQAQKTAVATLMYHCGVSVDMDYSPSGSGAVTSRVADALKCYFNYSSETRHLSRSNYGDDEWIALLKADLDLSRPIQYHGSGDGGGHSFVLDGYNNEDFFHVNWGWGSYCDEYYSLDDMNPGPGGIGSGTNGIYNEHQGAIVGIHPSVCTAAEPTNLSYTMDGRNISLSWDAADGAVSYNVYCNGLLAGNAATNSITLVAPFGRSVYFVRSVDTNGELSLASNTVTVTVPYPEPVIDDLEATLSGNNLTLSWTAPDWCYPSTPSDTLTYGSGAYYTSYGFNNGTTQMFWGHRYPAETLAEYNNMNLYKVSFYAVSSGDFDIYVYQGTTESYPETLILQQTVSVPSSGWNDVDLSNLIPIDATKDLWVFMHDPEARAFPGACCAYSGDEGNYLSNVDPSTALDTIVGIAFLIRSFVTDGTYTYNVYNNDARVAESLNATTYSVNNLAPGAYNYYVKTKYYAGESRPSNSYAFQITSRHFIHEGAWSEASNWQENAVPTATDAVLIQADCNLDVNTEVVALTVDDGKVLTIQEGKTLESTGAMTIPSAEALVIADGAQLKHSNAIRGTIQKHIVGYGDSSSEGGWYLIGVPMTLDSALAIYSGMVDISAGHADFTSHGIDLYEFSQAKELEWGNMRIGRRFYTLGIGGPIGYLYARADDATLNFGTLEDQRFVPTTENQVKTLIRAINLPAPEFVGWNLVSNPYTCSAYLASGRDFFRMNADGSAIVLATAENGGNAIKPCEGFFVVIGEHDPEEYYPINGQTAIAQVVMTTTEPDPNEGKGLLDVKVSCGNRLADVARVRFGEGDMLGKLVLNDQATRLSIKQDGKDYAVVRSNAQGEIPVNFKAEKNGTYTLSFGGDVISSAAKKSNLTYLHLIDNLTGADVDLLSGDCGSESAMTASSYTFTAKTTDYESRFRLVFSATENNGPSTGSGTFAFINDGNIIVNGEGMLQVIDVMGRILMQEENASCISTSGMTPGVYVLRLINGDSIRTQKIVVKA